MKHIKAIKKELYAFYYESKNFLFVRLPSFIKSRVSLFWCRLWIRKDEFHKSLDIDFDCLVALNEEQRNRYLNDLTTRRIIADKKDTGEL